LDPHFLPLDLGAFGLGGLHGQYRSPIVSSRRDGGSSAAPNPASCFHPTPTSSRRRSPGFCSPSRVRPGCDLSPQPSPPSLYSAGPTFGSAQSFSRDRQRASTRAPHAARSSPANPFLESPADSVTRAPNFRKLGQAGRARQDLVR